MSKDNDGLRPMVKKHLAYFTACVKHYGSDAVREVLTKGKTKKARLTIPLNRKDRWQMLQMLDLHEKPKGPGWL